MTNGAGPHMVLVIEDGAAPSVGRCMTSAASGVPLAAGATLEQALEQLRGPPRLFVITSRALGAALPTLQAYPKARVVVIAPQLEDSLLAAALRNRSIMGFLAWRSAGVRPWELSYLVRRAMAPQQVAPHSAELLLWGASSVTWRPRTTSDRDQTVKAVELVAMRFGISRRLAASAADAAHELLMNAMYDAPVDAAGTPRYAANRQADIRLSEHEVPILRLTVDSSHLALDIEDPFGRLRRSKLFGGILRGRSGVTASDAHSVLDGSEGGAGLGLFNLFSSAAVLRVEVAAGQRTLVSWIMDRTVQQREQRTLPRSLYYIPGEPP